MAKIVASNKEDKLGKEYTGNGAVKPRPGEVNEIRAQKRKEKLTAVRDRLDQRINLQSRYREQWLVRLQKQESLNTLKDLIEHWSSINVNVKGKPPNLYIYGNQHLSLTDWKVTFNLEHHRYKDIIRNEEYLRRALKNEGMTDEQLDSLLNEGKYCKVFNGK